MKVKASEIKYKVVMLIDDSEIDNCINEIIIKKTGFAENVYRNSSVTSSLEFFKNLEMFTNFPNDLFPSYLFLDINMPILDGFQFLDEFINFSTSLKRDIKIVILTSSANLFDMKKASHYKQVVKFLNKPLTEEDLRNLD